MGQHSSYYVVRGVGFYQYQKIRVEVLENRCFSKGFLQLVKGLLASSVEVESDVLLSKCYHRAYKIREVINKF